MGQMLMIVVLHVLGHGGILQSVNPTSVKGFLVSGFEILCLVGVNCFALITGFTKEVGKQK